MPRVFPMYQSSLNKIAEASWLGHDCFSDWWMMMRVIYFGVNYYLFTTSENATTRYMRRLCLFSHSTAGDFVLEMPAEAAVESKGTK